MGRARLLDLLVRQRLLHSPGLASRHAYAPVATPFVDPHVLALGLRLGSEGDVRPAILAEVARPLRALPTTPWGIAASDSPDRFIRKRRRRNRWDRWRARIGLQSRPARGAPIDLAGEIREKSALRQALNRATEPTRWEGLCGLRPEGPRALLALHLQGYRNLERPLLRLLLAAALRERLLGPLGKDSLVTT